MPRMQVTFNNVVSGEYQDHLSHYQRHTLMFQIEYRGKLYNCVGHLKSVDDQNPDPARVKFAGYYGYNGPINIQRLREAAEDYYQSTRASKSRAPRLFNIDVVESGEKAAVERSGAANRKATVLNESSKRYEFNVGGTEPEPWQQAS